MKLKQYVNKLLITISLCIITFGYIATAEADIIHESATLGTTGVVEGPSVSGGQYIGSRFSLTETYNIEQVGGHIMETPATEGVLFATIISLAPTALPADGAFNYLESIAIASTTFDPGWPILATDRNGMMAGLRMQDLWSQAH